jgi:hypothetical protein
LILAPRFQYATSFPLPRPTTPDADADADDQKLLTSTSSTRDYMKVGGGHEDRIDVGDAVNISHAATMKVHTSIHTSTPCTTHLCPRCYKYP